LHPRPQAAKRARVSFASDLAVATETLITQRGSATGLHGGGWGGHWPKRTEMPQLATGKGKEAMESPINTPSLCDVQSPTPKRHAGPRHAGSSYHNPGGGSGSADMTQVTGNRGRDSLVPNLNVPTDTVEAMLLDQDLSDLSPSVYTTSFLQPTTSLPISRPPRTGRRQQTKKKPVGLQKRPSPYSRKPDQL